MRRNLANLEDLSQYIKPAAHHVNMCLPIKSLISTSNSFQRNHNQPLPNQAESNPTAPQPPALTPIQSIDMVGSFTDCFRQIPNLYWQPGHHVGARVRTFRQIKYLPLLNAVPDLDQALSGARLDGGRDQHKQLIKYDGAAKVWMTVQVEYEPVNLLANKEPFEQYLSAAPTRIFQRNGPVSGFANLYIDSFRILTDQIREFNAKFIRDKSGL